MVKIFALIGVSGTGKSYNALDIARNRGIRYIIDDGLLIFDRRRIAGYSAKKENTYISAVKRALFFEDEHKNEILEALDREKPDKILLIATSLRMAEKIASRLEFNKVDEYVMVEDVLSIEEIQKARYHRDVHGKHVIPLPTLEIKKDFSGYFVDTIKAMVHSRRKGQPNIIGEERTVVRPTFSYLGKYTISNKAITEIVRYVSLCIDGISGVSRVKIVNANEILIELDCSMKLGSKINLVAKDVQKKIKLEVEEMTQLNIGQINISVKSLT